MAQVKVVGSLFSPGPGVVELKFRFENVNRAEVANLVQEFVNDLTQALQDKRVTVPEGFELVFDLMNIASALR